jgi:hypothetical protein
MCITQKIRKGWTILAVAQSVGGDTWVEAVRRISSTGTYDGEPVYAMSYMSLYDPGFTDEKVQVKILDASSNPHVCSSFTGYDEGVVAAFSPMAGIVFIWGWTQRPNEPGTTTEIYTSCITINLASTQMPTLGLRISRLRTVPIFLMPRFCPRSQQALKEKQGFSLHLSIALDCLSSERLIYRI